MTYKQRAQKWLKERNLDATTTPGKLLVDDFAKWLDSEKAQDPFFKDRCECSMPWTTGRSFPHERTSQCPVKAQEAKPQENSCVQCETHVGSHAHAQDCNCKCHSPAKPLGVMLNETRCCARCSVATQYFKTVQCGNRDCPCHSPAKPTEKCEHEFVASSTFGGFCKKCGTNTDGTRPVKRIERLPDTRDGASYTANEWMIVGKINELVDDRNAHNEKHHE